MANIEARPGDWSADDWQAYVMLEFPDLSDNSLREAETERVAFDPNADSYMQRGAQEFLVKKGLEAIEQQINWHS